MQSVSVTSSNKTVTSAQIVATGLAAYGIDRIFCVAGESYLSLLDALLDVEIDVVTCRHEGSAAFMAVADAKMTGRASVCIVNRGPGACNACIALHAAKQDASPLVLLVGDVRTTDMGRQAFQEMDYVKAFSDLAKGVWVLHDPLRVAEELARAIHVAESGTPGATVLVLPEDMLEASFIPTSARVERWKSAAVEPSHEEMEHIARLLEAAEKPLLIAGGQIASSAGRALLQEVVERYTLPVLVSNKRQDLFDNNHPHYAGHLHIATQERQRRLFAQADLILAVGTRLDYITTQRYTLWQAPVPEQKIIQVYPDASQIGFVYQPSIGLACEPAAFLRLLSRCERPGSMHQRQQWVEQLHTFEVEQATWHRQPDRAPDLLGAVVTALNELVPPDLILTVDAGNFTSWVHRYFRFSSASTFLGISSSAMGFGVPGGVAAALRNPDKLTVAFVGDGGFLMTGNELATAVQRKARLIIIIANNNSYGTIRQHQERTFPGRVVATDLHNPDFAELAHAYGALGLTIESENNIVATLQQAISHPGPVVVEVKTSLAWMSAYAYLPHLAAEPEFREA